MLCPHQLSFADGRKIRVTLDGLKRARDKMNKRAKASQFSTVSEDHIVTLDAKGNQYTKPSKDINLLGYQMHYDIVKDGGVDWLVGDVYIAPEKYETAKSLPFTSVEYHPDEDLISNIAFTKHRPQLDVGTITPYHWERGTVENTGYAGNNRLVAYSVESKQGGIVLYSTERTAMAPLADFITGMKGLLADLEASETPATPVVPAVAPVVTPATPTLPYSGVAMGGGSVGKTAEQELRELKRRTRLTELSKTRKMNVDEEMKAWGEESDEIFDKHVACATACYSAVSSGGATVTPLDHPGSVGGAGLDTKKKAQVILQKMADKGIHSNMQFVLDNLKANPSWEG